MTVASGNSFHVQRVKEKIKSARRTRNRRSADKERRRRVCMVFTIGVCFVVLNRFSRLNCEKPFSRLRGG